jgi:hypothetical protein
MMLKKLNSNKKIKIKFEILKKKGYEIKKKSICNFRAYSKLKQI